MKKIFNLFIVCLTLIFLCSCSTISQSNADTYSKEEVISILSDYYTIEQINSFINQNEKNLKENYYTIEDIFQVLNEFEKSLEDDVIFKGDYELTDESYFDCSLDNFNSYSTIRIVYGIGSYGPYGNKYVLELSSHQMDFFKSESHWVVQIDQLIPARYIPAGFWSLYIKFNYNNEQIVLDASSITQVMFSSGSEVVTTVSSAIDKVHIYEIIGVK